MGLRNWEVHTLVCTQKSDGLSTAVGFMINDEPHFKALTVGSWYRLINLDERLNDYTLRVRYLHKVIFRDGVPYLKLIVNERLSETSNHRDKVEVVRV